MGAAALFGPTYAEAYDALYAAKDYGAECRFIRDAVARYARRPVARVLDLGCGTGRHAVALAELGFAVTGVDRSAPMLDQARARAAASPAAARLTFAHGDITAYRAGADFDLVLMMFAVIGYQVEDVTLGAALATARTHLQPGGSLIFDCWYGPAVLAQRPTTRVKRLDHESGTLVRSARSELDAVRNLCTVHYDLEWSPRGGVVQRVEERHVMRFFFSEEIEQVLERSGFALRRLSDFEAPERAPSADSWNVWCVAEAV